MTDPIVTQSPDTEGWVEWTGGENPVPGRMVKYRLRLGYTSFGSVLSDNLAWSNEECDADIIAYRPVQSDAPAEQGGEREKIERVLVKYFAPVGYEAGHKNSVADAILAALQAAPADDEDWKGRALSAEASMDAIRKIEDAKAFGALSATDVACYRYPGEDQQALRGAFVDGVLSQSAWSIWLRGPDEIVAAKSYADAVEYCDKLNAEAPLVRAVPMPVGVAK